MIAISTIERRGQVYCSYWQLHVTKQKFKLANDQEYLLSS